MKLNQTFSLAIKIFLFTAVTTFADASTYDSSEYKFITLPEASRKKLPEAVRTKLETGILDVIERSPITVNSPQAKIGFEVSFEIKDISNIRKVEVKCTPLNSGLLNCIHSIKSQTGLKAQIHRSVSAFGGLVPLYEAGLIYEMEVNINSIENIRYNKNIHPALPNPGIDVFFDYVGGITQRKRQIQCARATETLAIPAEINNKGNVSLLACILRDKDSEYLNDDQTKNYEKDYNPGVYGGALYFWLEEQGIALPASLFYPNQLRGFGANGYYSLWRLLYGSSSSDSIFKFQNINFKFLE